MKSKILCLGAMLITCAPVFAQLEVVPRGQVRIGESLSLKRLSDNLRRDSLASVSIEGAGDYATGGTVSFGDYGYVSVGEDLLSRVNSAYGTSLILKGAGGLEFSDRNKVLLSYHPYTALIGSPSPSFIFSAPISAPTYITLSDGRLKSQIAPIEGLGEALSQLHPVSYRMNDESSDESESAKSRTSNPSNLHYGFVAQEVREVFPDLVYEDEQGMLSVDYQGLIAILTDAVIKLGSETERLEGKIEELKLQLDASPEKGVEQSLYADCVLYQNRPNPFSVSTLVECDIPEGVADCSLIIYDLSGSQKRSYPITQRGRVGVTIEGNALPAGMYIYALIADGHEIDSKRMILTD